MDWLSSEIASLDRQIKSVKQQLPFITFNRHEQESIDQVKTTERPPSTVITSIPTKQNVSTTFSSPINQRNIRVLKLLSKEPLLEGYLSELNEIYRFSTVRTIECVAIVLEQKSVEKYLFIKSINGEMDTYQMNESRSLNESYWNMTEPLASWNSAEKQLEFYRRFVLNNNTNEMMVTDQLIEMKSKKQSESRRTYSDEHDSLPRRSIAFVSILDRPRLNDVYFFDMMGQILRVKYHVDPSSLSCILEVFFGDIYSEFAPFASQPWDSPSASLWWSTDLSSWAEASLRWQRSIRLLRNHDGSKRITRRPCRSNICFSRHKQKNRSIRSE